MNQLTESQKKDLVEILRHASNTARRSHIPDDVLAERLITFGTTLKQLHEISKPVQAN